MNEIDLKFSSLGLLTYKFETKFKKVLLFLQTMDDPELLFNITCFLQIEELLALLSTCKKLNELKSSPIIEVRILRQKIRYLQSPKQAFNNLMPAYYQFLSHQKQENKEIPKNAEVFFNSLKEYKKVVETLKKRKEASLKFKEQGMKIIQSQKAYENKISKFQREIAEQSKIYQQVKLAKQPTKKTENQSYVQKFREQYAKIKQFERKRNIRELEDLHKKESEKIRITKQIETPFKTIPVIEIRDDEKLSVVSADSFYKSTAAKYLNRMKTIFGLNLYY